jgi:hypothetical protein
MVGEKQRTSRRTGDQDDLPKTGGITKQFPHDLSNGFVEIILSFLSVRSAEIP